MPDGCVAKLTDREKGILAVVRMNEALPRTEVRREFNIGRLRIVYYWRAKSNFWGRFGGGWNWQLGFRAGGRTVILNLLVFLLRFDVAKKEPANA